MRVWVNLPASARSTSNMPKNTMWGNTGPVVSFPKSLIAQSPKFFVRLAQTCIDLCDALARGTVPIPHPITEMLMIDEAARSYPDGHIGR
ncbi:hypothetical protein SAMN06264365_1284 [Actinoplanes regularis]|uniref:Uncharacterized protein n=1 Tax=Actinoplanes regularis TaxID=52697 RepID=A0A239I994_9ACTN|nr:hypothetical protein Are01nite_72000 [Actinoplanes regularis]SNS90117.1 hypothetical protein SAMN06264365_1284 [Actinoplanes regularis]